MKLIHISKRESTICPAGGFCRGEECSAFNWYDQFIYIRKYYKELDFPWYKLFGRKKKRQEHYKNWEENLEKELTSWENYGNVLTFNFECVERIHLFQEIYGKYALYKTLNPHAKWWCGLNK